MIGRLQGRVLEHADDGSCVLDVGGVGYEVFVPVRNVVELPLAEAVTLHVHTHVREDALMLYGFLSAEDRAAFRVLLGVSNVGPKLALTVLSDLSAAELQRVIARGERGRLEAISGVGKKTAARLLLELKDKLPEPAHLAPERTAELPAAAPLSDIASQVADALVRLGFSRAQAEAALGKLGPQQDGWTVEQLLRRALASLG